MFELFVKLVSFWSPILGESGVALAGYYQITWHTFGTEFSADGDPSDIECMPETSAS